MGTVEQTRSTSAPKFSLANVLTDGLYAGVIGATIVAVWFLIIDALAGRPFHTPTLLGTLLIRGTGALGQATVDPAMVAAYTAVHVVVFVVFGVIASYLVTLFDRYPAAGIVLVFLFAFFEVGFFVMSAALGGELLGRLGPWAVGIANLLSAAGMAAYLWFRHPHLKQSISQIWDE
jgi:hypothetical protein